MSSDQQLDVHVSVVNDLCHSKQNDSQYHEKCSVDSVINANNLLLETENENRERSGIEENVNPPVLEESETGISESGEILPVANNGHVVTDERDNVVCLPENGHSSTPFAPINKTTIPMNEDQSVAVDPVDSHERSETTQQSGSVDPSDDPPPVNSNGSNSTRCTENEGAQSCVQQEHYESNDDLPAVESHTNNDRPMSDSNADDDELEQNDDIEDDASNDGDDNFSNEHDSNEDCSDIEHSDGTTEVENDEYILDTVLRKPRKERRRIVLVNDDSDLEVDAERERLLPSPTVEENQLTDIEGEEDIEHLIQNEKPGPKSKKYSTQKLKEIQTRELLRNAVVIPSKKKKKSRVIDSDDDEEPLPYSVDVDDIGLPDTMDDNENDENDSDALAGSSILLNDANDFDKTENSIQNESSDVNSIDESTIKSESKDDNTTVVPQCSSDHNFSGESSRGVENQTSETVSALKEECVDPIENETGGLCDSGNSTDSTNHQNRKEMESNYANTDLPPFSASSTSESEDEFIPNEIYFGTPDHNSKRRSRPKPKPTARGRVAQPTTRVVKTVSTVARPTNKGRGGSGSTGRVNFIDNRRISSTSGSVSGTSSSDSDDEYQNSRARRKPATFTIVKQPSQLYHSKASLPVRPIQRQPNLQQIQRQDGRKRDRFYDKSRDIPNSVYFGDVDVPLHVLHAFGDSDSDNDKRNTKAAEAAKCNSMNRFLSQASRGRPAPKQSAQLHTNARKQSTNRAKARARPKAKADSSLSPSNDQSIQIMKSYLNAAGLKKVKLNRLWEGCKSNSERADKMLDLLREKGLEGEPTIAKCRQLKVDYLTKREIEDLDPNLIIQAEGRTRRSARAATRRQYTYDEDEILETRTKLRKVIDSDSDFE